MRRFLVTAMALLGVLALPTYAKAALVTGTLDLAGGVQVTSTSASWFLSVAPISGANEAFVIGNTVLDGGVPVTALNPPALLHETNLTNATTPAGTPLNVTMFEYNLSGSPKIYYDLNYVDTCAELLGPYVCLGTSPFGFIQNSDSVTVALQMRGIVYDGADVVGGVPQITNTWTGTWSTQVAGAVLCNQLGTGGANDFTKPCTPTSFFGIIETGGTLSLSYSGEKIAAAVPTVPEPATLLMFGTGIAVLGRRLRRAKKA